jgi:hypothetical protein
MKELLCFGELLEHTPYLERLALYPNAFTYSLLSNAYYPSTVFNKRFRVGSEIWDALPNPPDQPANDSIVYTEEDLGQASTEQADTSDVLDSINVEDMIQDIPLEEQDKYRKAWKKETTLQIADKQKLFSWVKSKEIRTKWSQRLFGPPKEPRKKASAGSKEERFKALLEKTENSVLNRERGLEHIIAMRKFLQSPSEDKSVAKELCLEFALETIQFIEKLDISIEEVGSDHHLRYSLEYHVGTLQVI